MSANAGPLAPYQATVAEDVRAHLQDVDFTHGELLRQAWAEREDAAITAALCLVAAEALGDAGPHQARPLATALAFLDVSSGLLRDLIFDDDSVAGGLQSLWGMPRLLNGGDAFFVLAQQSVLGLSEQGMDASRVLDAAARFEDLASRCWQSLAAAEPVRPALVTGALSLGAWAAGAPDAVVDALAAGDGLARADLAPEPRRRLAEALASVPGGS